MEHNKYYTPQIEEFRVGFEYEELDFIPVYDEHWKINVKKNVFIKEIWKTGYSNWQFLDNLKDGKIRVKYLDSSDIEDIKYYKIFQFKMRDSSEDELIFQSYYKDEEEFVDEEYIYWNIKYNTLKITHKSKTLFWGSIKNKSELVQVLKMIGVIE